MLAVGGGGGGFTGTTTTTLGYIAASSGGSPTTALQTLKPGNGGGSGASLIIDIDLTRCSTKQIGLTIGTGGSANTVPTSGGDTIIAIGGVTLATAGGGVGSTSAGGAASFNTALSACIMSITMADGEDGVLAQFEIVGRAIAYRQATPILTRSRGGLGGKPGLNGTNGSISYWAI